MTTESNSIVEYRDWSNDIPNDILELILSKVKLMSDFERFRAVCKQWCLVAASSYKERALLHTQWLVAKKDTESGVTVHLPLVPFSFDVDINELMCGASILCSKHGWLLMNKGRYKVFFFSFFSKSIIRLPNLPKPGIKFSGFTFTSNPTSKDCLVFGVCPNSYSRLHAYFISITVGDKDWAQTTLDLDSPYLNPCCGNPVYYMGEFYCLWRQGILLKLHSKLVSSKVIKPTKVTAEGADKSYLLEVEGELLAVFISFHNKVWVCKWDESNHIWHEVDDIGDYMFFLNERTSYAKKSTYLNMRNKLYFPDLDGTKHGVFYCLKTRKFQSFQNDFSGRARFKKTIVLESCWMDPTQYEWSADCFKWVKKSENCFVSNIIDDDDTFASTSDSEQDDDYDEDDDDYSRYEHQRLRYYTTDDDDYDEDDDMNDTPCNNQDFDHDNGDDDKDVEI